MNNNNSTRVNLNNVNQAPQVAPAQPQADAQENPEDAERRERDGSSNTQEPASENVTEPLIAPAEPTVPLEPQVPLITIVRTFVLSFFSSIIPEAPAL